MSDDIIVAAPSAIEPSKPNGDAIAKPNSNEDAMIALVPTAGTIALTDKQKATLYAPIDEDIIEIRPDGLIYLPWLEYVSRLRDAFGLGWSIVPKGMPMVKGDLICWGWWMLIDGRLAGFAIGEQKYSANNASMSWGDACEGAKSNALMRLCKGLGIGLELWRPSFIRKWKDKNAESFMEYNKYKQKDEIRWRKKAGEPVSEPIADEPAPEPEGDNIDFDEQMDKQATHAKTKATNIGQQIHIALGLKGVKKDDEKSFLSWLWSYQPKVNKAYCSMDDEGNIHLGGGNPEHLDGLAKNLDAAIARWKRETKVEPNA